MENELDNIQDDIADLAGVDWDQFFSPTDGQRITTTLPGPPSSESLFDDFPDNFFDPATLAEIDELERRTLIQGHDSVQSRDRVTSTAQAGPYNAMQNEPLSDAQTSRYFGNRNCATEFICDRCDKKDSPRKRRRPSSPDTLTPTKRTKMIHGNKGQAPSVEDLEEEFTCPICCDILAATHAANPCGHSFCGSCGERWIAKKTNDRCPICRTTLTGDIPMIPNIAMDNVIEKYIQILGARGLTEWTGGGERFEEWISRKEAWKQENLKRKNAAAHVQKYPAVNLIVAYGELDVPYMGPQRFGDVSTSLERSPRRRRRNRRFRN
ncbi:hypothetical protein AX15_005732 [Amanita polypyramis BW_CC]|nr:hypothetical protein AX15_005732 [Amanita polypyramis BW_CC]